MLTKDIIYLGRDWRKTVNFYWSEKDILFFAYVKFMIFFMNQLNVYQLDPRTSFFCIDCICILAQLQIT